MSRILERLPDQSYEAIRDRIGEILAAELRLQFVYTYDNVYNKIRVYLERFKPFDHGEFPAVNVSYWKGELVSEDQRGSQYTFSFLVDVYTIAASSETVDGDAISVKLCQKLTGNCKAILKDTRYKTLAFNPPFIGNVTIGLMNFENPESTQDKWSTAKARIVVEVRAADLNGLALSKALAGYRARVKINDSEKGYRYYGEPEGATGTTGGFDYALDHVID